jgi:hypothetical protein
MDTNKQPSGSGTSEPLPQQARSTMATGSTEPVKSESEINELKKAINNLIWMYAPPQLTLASAENIALDILYMVSNGQRQAL